MPKLGKKYELPGIVLYYFYQFMRISMAYYISIKFLLNEVYFLLDLNRLPVYYVIQ